MTSNPVNGFNDQQLQNPGEAAADPRDDMVKKFEMYRQMFAPQGQQDPMGGMGMPQAQGGSAAGGFAQGIGRWFQLAQLLGGGGGGAPGMSPGALAAQNPAGSYGAFGPT